MRSTYRLSGSFFGFAEVRRRPRFSAFSPPVRPKLRPNGKDGAVEAFEASVAVPPDETALVEALGGNGDRKL